MTLSIGKRMPPSPDSNRTVIIFACRKGYFLVELLVTVVILAVGILVVIDSIRMPIKAARRSLEIEQAIAVAKEVFAQVMNQPEKIDELSSGNRQIGSDTFGWQIIAGESLPISGFQNSIEVKHLRIHWKADKEYKLDFPFLWNE